MAQLVQTVATVLGVLTGQPAAQPPVLGPPCDVEIYCYGPILDRAQNCKLFPDSKTFVDMKMVNSPNVTKANFKTLMDANNQNPTCDQIGKFVNESFVGPDIEFENWTPTDWKTNPKIIDLINDADYKQWALELHTMWKSLGRQIIPDVAANPDQYSIIYVEHPAIVPGGRFREFYYWDSLWIIKGLLQSEMYNTTKGMLLNFKTMIDRYGFIPNGGRVYYTKRSQPPLYAAMVEAYVDASGDIPFAKEIAPTLEKELQYWIKNHTVTVQGYNLFKYGGISNGPRPESYREDLVTSSFFKTDAEKQECLLNLIAGAESGMDYSSRWFINSQGTNAGNLTNLKIRNIIPVDLNAYLYNSANIIANYYSLSDNMIKASTYYKKAKEIYNAVQAVLWDPVAGIWLDYDMINNKRRDYFVPSNLAPLWTKCYNISNSNDISSKVLAYLNRTKVLNYPGGIPNTLSNTGEQWDFPNIWPPMVHLIINALENLGTVESKNLAWSVTSKWVASNHQAYLDTSLNPKAMYEKYNAEKFAGHGGGGEYGIQLGFGWTNGVIMDLLGKYGKTLAAIHPL